jgi:hypothetical protein
MCTSTLPRRESVALTISIFILLTTTTVQSQTTSPASSPSDQTQLLNIHVTAVQGGAGAQFRPDANSKWQTVTEGLDLPEGVEFRTGPKGRIQFTVGTDQVYRVDRLTVLKVLRANLLPDGTIHTDVGMTYGRVSKDVDLPSHPHQDTIVSPSSTLAVRGTHVSLYDQPPYVPQAVSLTGAALFRNLHGALIPFGSHNGHKVVVDGDSTSTGDYTVNNTFIDPNGPFSGHTPPEVESLQNILSTIPTSQLGVFSGFAASSGSSGMALPGNSAVIGSLPLPATLDISMGWNTSSSLSQVDFTVTDPNGLTVNMNTINNNADGGVYTSPPGSNQAPGGSGFQDIQFNNGTIIGGTYKIKTTLSSSGSTKIDFQVSEFIVVVETDNPSSPNPSENFTAPPNITLNANNPTETFLVTAPVANGEAVTAINSHGHKTILIPP